MAASEAEEQMSDEQQAADIIDRNGSLVVDALAGAERVRRSSQDASTALLDGVEAKEEAMSNFCDRLGSKLVVEKWRMEKKSRK